MTDTSQQIPAPAFSARVAGVLELVVKIVVIGVPVLYALGRIYSQSYWRELHLPSSLMQNATEDYLYLGFVSVVNGLARFLGFAPYTTMGYAALFALAVALWTLILLLIDRWLGPSVRARLAVAERRIADSKDSKYGDGIRSALIGALVWSGLTIFLLVLFAAIFVIFLPILFADNEGKRAADIELSEQIKHQTPQGKAIAIATVAHYHNNGALVTAPLLDCSETWCVVFDRGAFVAIPRSDVVRVDQQRVQPTGN